MNTDAEIVADALSWIDQSQPIGWIMIHEKVLEFMFDSHVPPTNINTNSHAYLVL